MVLLAPIEEVVGSAYYQDLSMRRTIAPQIQKGWKGGTNFLSIISRFSSI
jgi:hypothetical protein